MDENRKKIKKTQLIINIIGIVIFLVLSVVIVIVLAPQIKEFSKNPELFKQYIVDHGIAGIFILLAFQVLQVIISLIPGELVEIGAGMAFGPFVGLLLCEIGMFIGTTFIYFFSKKVGKPTIQAFIGDKMYAKLEKIDENPKRDKVLFLIFLIPGLPKDLLSYLVAFFSIGFWKFMAINLVARIPSILSSTIAGRFIINGDYTEAAIIFLITGAFAVLCFFLSDKIMNSFNKYRKAKKELKEEQENQTLKLEENENSNVVNEENSNNEVKNDNIDEDINGIDKEEKAV